MPQALPLTGPALPIVVASATPNPTRSAGANYGAVPAPPAGCASPPTLGSCARLDRSGSLRSARACGLGVSVMAGQGVVAVCGATGRQGGAVVRALRRDQRPVRALTRRPASAAARALGALGAEVVAADMDDVGSLRSAFAGTEAVFSVQNGMVSGFAGEARQGVNVADAASAEGVGHFVYASAGPVDEQTGVPSWDVKRDIEAHLARTGLPTTVLRPTAFMELMTDAAFYPAVGTWRIWPKLTGDDRPIPWLAVDDLGAIAAHVLREPAPYAGATLKLVGDVRTLAECRDAYTAAAGHPPRTFPLPIWLFNHFTKKDVIAMWRWLRQGPLPNDKNDVQTIVAQPTTIEDYLARQLQRPAR